MIYVHHSNNPLPQSICQYTPRPRRHPIMPVYFPWKLRTKKDQACCVSVTLCCHETTHVTIVIAPRTKPRIIAIQLIKRFGETIFFNFTMHLQYRGYKFGVGNDVILIDILQTSIAMTTRRIRKLETVVPLDILPNFTRFVSWSRTNL